LKENDRHIPRYHYIIIDFTEDEKVWEAHKLRCPFLKISLQKPICKHYVLKIMNIPITFAIIGAIALLAAPAMSEYMNITPAYAKKAGQFCSTGGVVNICSPDKKICQETVKSYESTHNVKLPACKAA